jgi:tight adherence protein B
VIALGALVVIAGLAVQAARRATADDRVRRRLLQRSPRHRLGLRLPGRIAELRRARAVERTLPDVLDAVARSLRSGSSMRQAIEEAGRDHRGPLADELARVTSALQGGAPLAAALERWDRDRSVPGVRLAVAALCLGAETGGASARAIDGVAATLRTNLAIAGEVRALSSQARLSALVIVLAPLAVSVIATSSDGGTARFLLATPIGLACLTIGLGLDGIGWLWMRRVVAAVAP